MRRWSESAQAYLEVRFPSRCPASAPRAPEQSCTQLAGHRGWHSIIDDQDRVTMTWPADQEVSHA